MRGGIAVAAAVLVVAPGSAQAGRTFYGWLFGTEVMPERMAELSTWVGEQNDKSAEAHASQTDWGVNALVGVNDRLELAFPVEVEWSRNEMPDSARTALSHYGVEARYRFVTQDPVEAPPFVPLVRVAVLRNVLVRDVVQPELDFVGSYQTGRVHALVDLGMSAAISRDDQHFYARPGAGLSISVSDELRVGAEVIAEISLDSNGESWAAAGPNLSWSHGRTWVSATYGIGIYQIKDAPRLQWGIAF